MQDAATAATERYFLKRSSTVSDYEDFFSTLAGADSVSNLKKGKVLIMEKQDGTSPSYGKGKLVFEYRFSVHGYKDKDYPNATSCIYIDNLVLNTDGTVSFDADDLKCDYFFYSQDKLDQYFLSYFGYTVLDTKE